MKRIIVILILAIAASFTSYGQETDEGGKKSELHSQADQRGEVEQTIRKFLLAFTNRDVPAFIAFFAEDATMFFPSNAPTGTPSGRVQGRTEIERTFKTLHDNIRAPSGTTRAPIQPQDLMIQKFDEFAVVTFQLGSDKARGRRTFVLRRISSEWKIVHLHASDFRTEQR